MSSCSNSKIDSVRRSLDTDDIDLMDLQELALTRGGFINAELRQVAWSRLLGCTIATEQPALTIQESSQEIDLIHQDVRRSVLFHYQNIDAAISAGESSSQHDHPHQELLADILITLVSLKPLDNQAKIHYYQGLHDVAAVVLYNFHPSEMTLIVGVLQRICLDYFLRDATKSDLKDTAWFLQTVLEPMLSVLDVELLGFLTNAGLELPNFVLPWVITWFAHDVYDPVVSSRLFDVLVSSHALFPLYLALAVLLRFRREILQCDQSDPAMVHMTIRGLMKKNICPDWQQERQTKGCIDNSGVTAVEVQDLIDDARTFMNLLPPDSLMSHASWYYCHADSSGLDPYDYEVDLQRRAQSIASMQHPYTVTPGIFSDRLQPCRGLVSHESLSLSARILCADLISRDAFMHRYPGNCFVFAWKFRRRLPKVLALVIMWNRQNLLCMGIRQANQRIKTLEMVSTSSLGVSYLFELLLFFTAFVKVMLRITVDFVVISIAIFLLHLLDAWVWN